METLVHLQTLYLSHNHITEIDVDHLKAQEIVTYCQKKSIWTPESIITKIKNNEPLDLVDKYHPDLLRFIPFIESQCTNIDNETMTEFQNITKEKERITVGNYEILI